MKFSPPPPPSTTIHCIRKITRYRARVSTRVDGDESVNKYECFMKPHMVTGLRLFCMRCSMSLLKVPITDQSKCFNAKLDCFDRRKKGRCSDGTRNKSFGTKHENTEHILRTWRNINYAFLSWRHSFKKRTNYR